MSTPSHSEKEFFTYDDYKLWPDEERWEIIDGEPYNMSPDAWPSRSQSDRPGPAPGMTHQKMLGEIHRQIANFLEDKPCDVYVAPFDVRLAAQKNASDDEIFNVVQPDVSVFCSEEKLDDAGAVAAPDIAVKVLSPYTSVKDQREKLALYERFGVKEYWIIDPANQTLSVYSLNGGETGGAGGSYSKPVVYGPEDSLTSAVLKSFSLHLEDVLRPLKKSKK